MKREPSFSQRLKQGWSKEKLMQHYSISESQYQKLITCLEDLKRIERERKENPNKGKW